jgi:large subunit ribosomal protein L32e
MKKPATSITTKAVKLRERVKRNKPKFVRQESWRFKRLKENWRRPRGLDNKMRRKIKGWPPTVNTGYRGPKVSRGLHPSGYREVLVFNLKELKGIDPKTQAIKIAHAVGNRKRAKILVEARKKKITILNLKEVKEVAKKEEEEELEKEEEVEEEVKKEEPKRKKAKGEQEDDGGS